MKKLISAIFLFAMLCFDISSADALPNLDRTCKTCSRQHNDSVNVFNRRPIRLNQSGFRPQDYKYAYVADTKEKTFKVIDANSGKEVPGGGNLSLIGTYTRPGIFIKGAYNSISTVYDLGDSASNAKETLYRRDNGMAWSLAYELGLCKICLEYRIRQHSMEVVQASFPFNLHSSILIRLVRILSTTRRYNLANYPGC